MSRRKNWKYDNDINQRKVGGGSRKCIYRTVKVTHLFAVIDRKEVLKCRQEAGKMWAFIRISQAVTCSQPVNRNSKMIHDGSISNDASGSETWAAEVTDACSEFTCCADRSSADPLLKPGFNVQGHWITIELFSFYKCARHAGHGPVWTKAGYTRTKITFITRLHTAKVRHKCEWEVCKLITNCRHGSR